MASSLFKWFFAGICLLNHPFYVSVTEIDYKSKNKILEISCKMFTNDLESVLEKKDRVKVDLSHPADKNGADKLIGEYVASHLHIKVNGREIPFRMIGSEQESDGTWSYFEADGIPAIKRIDLSNSLLYDAFPQQINIIHITVDGVRKSTQVTNPDPGAYLEF